MKKTSFVARSINLIFPAVLMGFAAGPLFAEDVTFKYQTPVQGDVEYFEGKNSMNFKMLFSVQGRQILEQEYVSTEDVHRTETTLGPSSLRVVYDTWKTYDKVDKEIKSGNKPVSGKTYLVRRSSAGLEITYPGGGAPGVAEKTLVKKDFEYVGHEPDSIGKKLSGRTFTVGKRVSLLEDSLRKKMSDDESKILKNEIIFTGTRACGTTTCGVFLIDLLVKRNTSETISMTMEFKGELLVKVNDCGDNKMVIRGPIKISGQVVKDKQTISIKGGGEMYILFMAGNFQKGKKPADIPPPPAP